MPTRAIAILLFVSFVLVGCTISVGPIDPFPDAIPVNATTDPAVAAAAGTLTGGDSVVYEVDLSNAAGADVIYIELDQDLALSVYRSNGTIYASSSSADGFAAGFGGLGATGTELAPQAIGVDVICRGACVIASSLGGSVFVEIENPNASPRNYDLFVFGDGYADTAEPANDVPATAPVLTTSDEGAIETLGDVDYYAVLGEGSVLLETATGALPIRAGIVGTAIVIEDGEATEVLAGDVLWVEVEGGAQAAASAVSGYRLTFTAGPGSPFPGAVPVNAGSDSSPVASDTLGGFDSVVYRVDLGGTTGADVVYFELDQALALTVYTSGGTAYASSSSADGFAAGLGGLGATRLGAQAIDVDVICRGSCVIGESLGSSVFVEIENLGASPTNYDFYAFGDVYQDTGEPGNDAAAGATLVIDTDDGAIETLGDVDYYEMASAGTVRFDVNSAAHDIRAYVDAVPVVLTSGQTYEAIPGDIVRVEVVGGASAGPSAVTGYTLSYMP